MLVIAQIVEKFCPYFRQSIDHDHETKGKKDSFTNSFLTNKISFYKIQI